MNIEGLGRNMLNLVEAIFDKKTMYNRRRIVHVV